MNKILLVLQREYLVRVRKKSFLIMTLLTPLLFAGLFIVPVFLTLGLEKEKIVEVVDETGKIAPKLEGKKKLKFETSKYKTLKQAKDSLNNSAHYAILYIPKIDIKKPEGVKVFAEKSISLDVSGDIQNAVRKAVEDIKLLDSGIDKKVLASIKSDIDIETETLAGEKSNSGMATIIGFITAFVIYMAVFLYGSQVMRGVIEEKSNRIIEVIISSVKPFQLMMGKILGVALIGLTQFVLWIILTFGIVTVVSSVVGLDKMAEKKMEQSMENSGEEGKKAIEKMQKQSSGVFSSLGTIPIVTIIVAFLFYFIGGYLLYSSMFAAAASAVDSEAEMQQFVLPISIPLIIAIVAMQAIIRDPDGSVAFWMSMIPFTSPIIMMARIPFGGVDSWELVLSIALLMGSFIAMTWVTARIYRVGILMYGKKVNFRELGKWIFYKN